MTTLYIERFGHDIDSTWGRLSFSSVDDHFFTVEPPWNFNRRFQSCLPCGTYDLVRHNSAQRPNSWALIGDGVSHMEQPGVARYACLIHVANWARELKGCIAPGESIQHFDEVGPGVTDSRRALERIDEILSAATRPTIEIRSGWG